MKKYSPKIADSLGFRWAQGFYLFRLSFLSLLRFRTHGSGLKASKGVGFGLTV